MEHKERSEMQCLVPNLRRANSELGKAIRKLVRIKAVLRSRQAKKWIAPPAREALLAAVEGIRADLQTLKGALACPGG